MPLERIVDGDLRRVAEPADGSHAAVLQADDHVEVVDPDEPSRDLRSVLQGNRDGHRAGDRAAARTAASAAAASRNPRVLELQRTGDAFADPLQIARRRVA